MQILTAASDKDGDSRTTDSVRGRVAAVEVTPYPLTNYRLLACTVTAIVARSHVGAPVTDGQNM